jgi:hypothetical protein
MRSGPRKIITAIALLPPIVWVLWCSLAYTAEYGWPWTPFGGRPTQYSPTKDPRLVWNIRTRTMESMPQVGETRETIAWEFVKEMNGKNLMRDPQTGQEELMEKGSDGPPSRVVETPIDVLNRTERESAWLARMMIFIVVLTFLTSFAGMTITLVAYSSRRRRGRHPRPYDAARITAPPLQQSREN